MSTKQEVLNIVASLPENLDLEDLMYKLYVLQKIHEGDEAIKNGKTLTMEEMKKEVESW